MRAISLRPGLGGTEECLFHRPAVCNTALNLVGYCPGDQISIKFRLGHLLDIQPDPFPDKLLQLGSHFINPLSPSSDNNTGTGGMDGDEYLMGLALNLDLGDGSLSVSGADSLPDFEVFLQELSIELIGVPFRLPIADNTKSET